YYGVIGPDTLRIGSAPDSNAAVTPAGVAAIYGSNLAPVAQEAGVQPPPLSLAGLMVTVKDSLGVSRPAQLYYGSPGQIKIRLPAQTAPGTASFIISGTGRADLV